MTLNAPAPELPFAEPAPDPRELARHTDALRAAWRDCGLWQQGISFTHALAIPALRIGMANVAEIRARRILERAAS